VKLYEVGPVVFPAYEDTSVALRSNLTAILGDDEARYQFASALMFGQLEDREDDEVSDDEAAGDATAATEPPKEALSLHRPHLRLVRDRIEAARRQKG